MPKFSYVLTDENGAKKEGSVSAASLDAAKQMLRADDVIVLSVLEETKKKKWLLGRPKMSMQEKMIFVKNLSAIIDVGVNIVDGLEMILSQTTKPAQRLMIEDIIDRIKSGQSLANSLRRYDNVFSNLFISMIETGEESGNLDSVLRHLDHQIEKDYDTRRKIISAFIYPAVIIAITLFMSLMIVIFVMPKITAIFEKFDMDLPLPTKMMIGLSNFIIETPVLAVSLAIVLISFIVFLFKAKMFKPFWHNVLINLPIFGKMMVEANVARFGRALNSLLEAGLPITKSLDIISGMLTNVHYQKMLSDSYEKVEKGGKLSESVTNFPKIFPILAQKIVYIGETTGSMEMASSKIAEIYEKKVDAKTKNLATILEPLLLVFMAAMVGGIAMAIILPIYQLPGLLNG